MRDQPLDTALDTAPAPACAPDAADAVAAAPATTRVFIALAPPDDAKEELARELRPALDAYPSLRWNRIEDWHITLAFLGELPVGAVPPLRAPLAALAAARPPLELGLSGAGHFDERVLWSGIDGDVAGLRRLAADVRDVVRQCGIPFEDRPLNPHLTLARARRGDTGPVTGTAAALAGFTGRRWPTARLHLVASNIGRGPGPIRYRDLESWAFEGHRTRR